jgi:hypothetical protein
MGHAGATVPRQSTKDFKMARSFEFSVLRLMPDPARGEMINLGIVVFREGAVDIRVGEVITRARLLYPELTPDSLREGIATLQRLGAVSLPAKERYAALRQIGPFALGDLGHFTPEGDGAEAYETNVARLMRIFTSPARAAARKARPASRLATVIRKVFRDEKVLAQVGDAGAIAEHKIVPEWPLPSQPSLRADLALKNGIVRVCEIVDLHLSDEGPAPASLFEGVVTLDVAQRLNIAQQTVFAYRAAGPTARIEEALKIARLHASQLVNWDQKKEKEEFLHEWIDAAKVPAVGQHIRH